MQFLSTFVASTAFKYLVTMVATFLASKLGIEQGSIEGILTQAVGLGMLIWGTWESSRNKLVLDGERVSLPANVAPSAEAAKDILIGRVKR